MANENVLLINRDDIMRLSGLKGNIDEDKLLPHIKSAQDIHLQPVIGTLLLDKCRKIIKDGTLDDVGNEAYKLLIETFITPFLVFLSLWDAMPFLQYEIANGGVFQHNSENSATPTDEAVTMLIQKFKDKGDFYGARLTEHLCDNSDELPELNASTEGAEMPDQGSDTFHGINI